MSATTTETEFSQQFEFAAWRLTQKGDRKLMEDLLAKLEDTRTGRQIAEARRLLNSNNVARETA